MDPELVWRLPPSRGILPSDEVHVWRVSLEQTDTCLVSTSPASGLERLSRLLSADERTRGERFHFERDRRRFISARGVLRIILGSYLGIEPDQLQFGYGPHGKPYLSSPGGPAIRFNLAHSHELALYAFAYGREVGIDVEQIRPLPDCEQLAARFFAASENAALHRLPEDQRPEAFFNCWTRKEAYLKALGDGLSQPLDQFQVSLTPGEPARLSIMQDPQEAARWSIETLFPAPGYAAALVAEGHNWRLKCWQYPSCRKDGVQECTAGIS